VSSCPLLHQGNTPWYPCNMVVMPASVLVLTASSCKVCGLLYFLSLARPGCQAILNGAREHEEIHYWLGPLSFLQLNALQFLLFIPAELSANPSLNSPCYCECSEFFLQQSHFPQLPSSLTPTPLPSTSHQLPPLPPPPLYHLLPF
jgi:hypothetical protein